MNAEKDERLWCACKRNGVPHVWEPGEWCSPVRVEPKDEKAQREGPVTRANRLLREIEQAVHEEWCGKPLTCDNSRGCQGRINNRELAAIRTVLRRDARRIPSVQEDTDG